MARGELSQYLLDERAKMIVDMRKKGYTLKDIAGVFRVSKVLVHQILKTAGVEPADITNNNSQ